MAGAGSARLEPTVEPYPLSTHRQSSILHLRNVQIVRRAIVAVDEPVACAVVKSVHRALDEGNRLLSHYRLGLWGLACVRLREDNCLDLLT